MPKSRRARSSSRRTRKKRGKGMFSGVKMPAGMRRAGSPILGLVARYIRDIIKPNTIMPKTRQLMLDSFIYASLLGKMKAENRPVEEFSKIAQPKYGVHYMTGAPVKGGSGEDEAINAARVDNPQQSTTGGRKRRKSKKSRRKSKKSRRKSKKSRRRRRR